MMNICEETKQFLEKLLNSTSEEIVLCRDYLLNEAIKLVLKDFEKQCKQQSTDDKS